MSLPARFYIALVIALGGSLLLMGLLKWELQNPARLLVFSVFAAAVSRWKVSLPAIKGTMSVNFLVILVSIVQMSLTETLLLGCGSIVVQYLWHAKERRQVLKVLFNLSSVTVAITLSYDLFHWGWLHAMGMEFPLKLALVACIYFVVNTGSVAVVIAFTEGKGLAKVWRDCYFWSFPYYILGAAVVGLFDLGNRVVGWQTSVLVLPVVYLIYRSYHLYLGRLETEKTQAEIQRLHAEEMSALHLRTIEALALAIAAKDSTTHDHLQRVQVYALEIGRELGLAEDELEALRAAALLHDIGKLAVPEHIISKPGKLTPEEFEKMKIHPLVGAEILDRVQFPYSVAPIVRSHHEKWNGAGYPHGLRGEQIPIGARILAAVDCLDALASDRQYRRALPLDEAMAWVAAESGKSFDPRVVGILHRRYRELDEIARETPVEDTRLSTNVRIHRGAAPAAGFEHSGPAALTQSERRPEFLASIAAAREEVQVLFEMAQDLGNSLRLDDTLSVLGVRLKKIIPYEGMAVYMLSGDELAPAYTTGDDFRLFSSLRIPRGQGLSGWVLDNRKAIINGNPSVEAGYLNDPAKFSTLRSALAVPLEGASGPVGVLALYRAAKDAFTTDHLRVLLAVSSKLGLSIENSMKYREAEGSAVTDYLTGLPNARSLFLHLEREMARCRDLGEALTVLVADLDGFKEVNDRFGHLEGNRVLRAVARGLQLHCREYDYVARMGGDEFVMVLPGLSTGDTREVVERFRQAAMEAGRMVCGHDLLSLSVGQAEIPAGGCAVEELLAEADRQMYNSKRAHKSQRLEPVLVA